MTKADLVRRLKAAAGITKTQAEKAVGSFVSAATETLSAGEKLTLVGFGTFSVVARSAREGRNPRTGEKINIAASKAVKFKPGKGLCAKVN